MIGVISITTTTMASASASTKTKAKTAKENGNGAFKAGDYPAAIGHYTQAILADNKDVTYPLNRAAAYLKLGKYVSSVN